MNDRVLRSKVSNSALDNFVAALSEHGIVLGRRT
jgi:hypothetical protein